MANEKMNILSSFGRLECGERQQIMIPAAGHYNAQNPELISGSVSADEQSRLQL